MRTPSLAVSYSCCVVEVGSDIAHRLWEAIRSIYASLLVCERRVAGIGPEIIARAWPALQQLCRPVVVGDETWMRQALRLVQSRAQVAVVQNPQDVAPAADVVPLLAGSVQDLSGVEVGRVSAAAGKAAH